MHARECRNRGKVKVTHDTDATHDVLDVNTDRASQDEELPFIPEGASTSVHEVNSLALRSLLVNNDV